VLLVELLHSPNPAVLLAAAQALLDLANVRGCCRCDNWMPGLCPLCAAVLACGGWNLHVACVCS